MDETAFTSAIFAHATRPHLLAALRGDPVLQRKAREQVAKLDTMNRAGQIFDRDHVSREMHKMLTVMLASVDAAKGDEPQVTVE